MRSRSRLIVSALRLEPRERWLALRALAWVAVAGAAIRLLSFSTLIRWLERVPRRRSPRAALSPRECERAVSRASRVLRAQRCLPLAVAAACMLRRAGHIPVLRIGVALAPPHRLDAHAWLECGGVVVTGGEVSDGYAALGGAGLPGA